MDDATPRGAQSARLLEEGLARLAHAVRTLRFNVADERRGAMLDSALTLLQGVLAQTPQIDLFVEPYRLLWQTRSVYEEQDRAESLAFRLYRDGISAVVITHELGQKELAQFVDLLAAPPQLAEQAGEDPVTRLWSTPLKAIWVCERPWFGLRLLDPTCQDPLALGELAGDSLVFLAPGGHDSQALTQQWQSKAQLAQSWERLVAGHRPQQGSAFLSQLSTSHMPTFKHPAIRELEELLLSAAEAPRDLAPPAVLGELTLVLIKSLMSLDQPKALEHLYDTMGDLLETLPNPERVVRLREALAYGTNLTALRQLLLHISHQPQTQESYAWAPRFFSERFNSPIKDCAALFSLNLSSRAFELLVETLWMRQGEDVTFWSPILSELQGTSAVELLNALASRGDEAFNIMLATRGAQHPDSQARAAALTHLPDVDDERVRKTLIEALRDLDSQVRVAALTHMGHQKEGALGIFLVERFQHSKLLSLPQEELRALTDALVNLGGSRYTSLLLASLDHLSDELRAKDSNQAMTSDALAASRMILNSLTRLPHQSVRHKLAERLESAPASLNHDYVKALRTLDERLTPVADPSRSRPLRSRSIQRLRRLNKTQTQNPDDARQGAPSDDAASAPSDTTDSSTPPSLSMSSDASLTGLLNAYLNEDSSLHSIAEWLQPPAQESPTSPHEPPWMNLDSSAKHIDHLLRDYLALPGELRSSGEVPAMLHLNPHPSHDSYDDVLQQLKALTPSSDPGLSFPSAQGPAGQPLDAPADASSEGFIPDTNDTSWLDQLDDPALNTDVVDIIDKLMSRPPESHDEGGPE